ncbi:hypothetical protein KCU68_g22297, partial [Aureobasidium melanogenum]
MKSRPRIDASKREHARLGSVRTQYMHDLSPIQSCYVAYRRANHNLLSVVRGPAKNPPLSRPSSSFELHFSFLQRLILSLLLLKQSKMDARQVGSATKDIPAEGVVHAALAKKQPPPESLQGVKTRRWIIFSFWAIVGLLGLPIWFATTTVPRAALPLD